GITRTTPLTCQTSQVGVLSRPSPECRNARSADPPTEPAQRALNSLHDTTASVSPRRDGHHPVASWLAHRSRPDGEARSSIVVLCGLTFAERESSAESQADPARERMSARNRSRCSVISRCVVGGDTVLVSRACDIII